MKVIKARMMLNCPKSGLILLSDCKPTSEGGCEHLHYYSLSTYDIECHYKPFSESCRFGGFCTDKKLYESCVKDKRVKNNWLCWRDGVMKEDNNAKQTS